MATIKRTVATGLPAETSRLKRTLYVGGLEEGVDREALAAAFTCFGELRTVEIPVDRTTGKHRGFGFVEFSEEEDAAHAIDNMNEAELRGRVLTVNLARTPARRPGEGRRAVWEDDSFLRQRIATDPVLKQQIVDEDVDLNALLQCGEAEEALKARESAAAAADIPADVELEPAIHEISSVK